MHASTMTSEDLDKLERDVFQFHADNSDIEVKLTEAAKHFKDAGHTLTRPIERTLQVYGVVERDDGDTRSKYPFPVADKFWTISKDGKSLCPNIQA